MLTVVGLENEGGRGKFSRHAVGARFLDFVADLYGVVWTAGEKTEFASIEVDGVTIRLLRQTKEKLHNCGEVLVPELLETMVSELVVVYDEANLDLGASELMTYWSDNGHLGLVNLTKELGTTMYSRAGIGTGRIPPRSDWEEFFNGEMDEVSRELVKSSFSQLWEQIRTHLTTPAETPMFYGRKAIPAVVALEAQLPRRERNLLISPVAVTLNQTDVKRIDRAVSLLSTIIQRVMGRYALALDERNAGDERLVVLLEAGVPKEMLPLVRMDGARIEGVSFDFHRGKLLEINAAPLPPLVVGRVAQRLSGTMVGEVLTQELLTQRVRILANRRKRVEGRAQILLVDKIASLALGKTGWMREVSQYLTLEGYEVVTGSIADYPEANVIWANLTWMTPDRWPSVVSARVWENRARIFPSPRNFLFTSKWFLRLLSNGESQEVLGISQSEAEELAEFVPWTGGLTEATDVIRMLLRNGMKVYGKPFLSSGGRGGGAIHKMADLRKIQRPAVVQEWNDPYEIPALFLYHDLRVVVYGGQGQHRIWQARVWGEGKQLQRPMDAPVFLR